jgi:hypothetical protein
MLITIFFLLTVLLLAVSNAEGLATGIAGLVAPILAQIVKRLTGADGTAALVVTVVVSAAIAVGSLYLAGEIHGFGDVLKQAMAVFGIATLLYKGFTAVTQPAK